MGGGRVVRPLTAPRKTAALNPERSGWEDKGGRDRSAVEWLHLSSVVPCQWASSFSATDIAQVAQAMKEENAKASQELVALSARSSVRKKRVGFPGAGGPVSCAYAGLANPASQPILGIFLLQESDGESRKLFSPRFAPLDSNSPPEESQPIAGGVGECSCVGQGKDADSDLVRRLVERLQSLQPRKRRYILKASFSR